ncbi:hypothetical protein [Streptomyces clavifer]|uniref:hypothetical protein n=1 Tax=Streptomyces clavifer TaxID=68188 RepID=UPI003816D9E1
MHRPHHPDRRPPAPETAAERDDDFENAVLVRANEPAELVEGGIAITLDEFRLCAQPLHLVVLMNWRFRAQDGLPRSARNIWAALTARGVRGDDGEGPLLLADVEEALAFLSEHGLVVPAPGGEL